MRSKIFLLFIYSFIIVSFITALDSDPGIVNDMQGLGVRAEEIKLSIKNLDRNDVKFLYAVSDYHAVFDLDMDDISVVIADHDNGEKVFSRMVDTVDLNPEDDLSVPHRQSVYNSAKFLGIGQDYRYTTIVNVQKSDENEFIMSWLMTDSEEGNFEEYEGFWYLQRLNPPDSVPRTYVRLYAETLFNNPIPFQEMIMNMFTKGETQEVFKSLYKAVKK